MKKDNNTQTKMSTLEKHRKTTNANYMMGMTALLLILLIVVNMLVSSLNSKYRQVDLTKGDIFSLTDVTKNMLSELDKDVTITMILENIVDRNDDLYRVLQAYEDECDKIHIDIVDPVQNPTFMADRAYVSEGGIIVECDGRCKGIDLSSMILSDEDANTGITTYYYDMEGQITSAINYVLSDSIPKAYVLNSSSRDVFDDTLVVDIQKQNIDISAINIEDTGEIPEDADIIILDQPAKDISDAEYEGIIEFMDNGGSLMVVEYYNNNDDSELDNIEKLLEKYGIVLEYGCVVEKNGNYTYDTNGFFKPVFEEHEITKDLISEQAELIVAMGDHIKLIDAADSVTVDALLTSTSTAYYKDTSYKKSGSMSQLSSDPTGIFNYAVAVTDDIAEDVQARAVIISSYSFAETDAFASYGTGNEKFMVKCMQWLANQEETISIPIKSRTYGNLVYTTVARSRIMYVVVIIIPVAVLAYGGYVWLRRRRR